MLNASKSLQSDPENGEYNGPASPPNRVLTGRKSEQACELVKKIKFIDPTFHIINGEGAGK